jgi:hypothetical protein
MNKGRILICGGPIDVGMMDAIRHAGKMGVEVVCVKESEPPPEPENIMTLKPCLDWPMEAPPPIQREPWRKGRKDARFKGRG